jgi:hypothetical protein
VTSNSIACPECGAALKSSTGFVPGQAVSCPKCETEFTVEDGYNETADDAARAGSRSADRGQSRSNRDKEAWSYQNSWLRYAVLGVLVVVLGVLGYLLYDKRMKEGKETASDDSKSRGITPGETPQGLIPLQPPPVGAGAGPGPKPKDKIEPKAKAPTVDEARAMLAGKWGGQRQGEIYTIEYTADGKFSYTLDKEAQPKKVISGEWVLKSVDKPAAAANQVAELRMEWTVAGKPAIKELAVINRDGSLFHTLLDRNLDGQLGGETFTRKK